MTVKKTKGSKAKAARGIDEEIVQTTPEPKDPDGEEDELTRLAPAPVPRKGKGKQKISKGGKYVAEKAFRVGETFYRRGDLVDLKPAQAQEFLDVGAIKAA
jgi:hypothetical protein